MITRITRRRFVQRMGGLAAGAMLAPTLLARQEEQLLVVTAIEDDVWLITGAGGNTLLIASDDGPILIDAKIASAARAVHAEVVRLAGSPPKLLINTHHHADHVGGNYVFSGDAEIIAHKNLKPRLDATIRERILPSLEPDDGEDKVPVLSVKDFAADRAIGATHELEFGGRKLILRHFGPGHTDNDLVVYLPDVGVVHAGDLLFHKLHPYVDRPGGADTVGWERSVQRVIDLIETETRVVPGHGELADPRGLERQIAYFQQTREYIVERMNAGEDRSTIVRSRPPFFADYGFARVRRRTLEAMYDELAEQAARRSS